MKMGRFSINHSEGEEYNDPPRPFLEHLLDLRDCVIKCAISWAVCALVIIPFIPKIIAFLKAPAGLSADKIQGLGWTVGFDVSLRVVFWGGTTLSLPLLTYFIYAFYLPGVEAEREDADPCLPRQFHLPFFGRRVDGVCNNVEYRHSDHGTNYHVGGA